MPLPNPLIVLMPERPLALFLKFVFQGHPWGFPGGFQGVRSMEPTTKTGGGPGYGSIAPLPREWKIREPLSRTKTSKMACCHKFVQNQDHLRTDAVLMVMVVSRHHILPDFSASAPDHQARGGDKDYAKPLPPELPPQMLSATPHSYGAASLVPALRPVEFLMSVALPTCTSSPSAARPLGVLRQRWLHTSSQ
eukprot:CAMPEP_0174284046 /NCGR_PEP_ID=MMETSP0809-20121228/4760_1 /TAXON_ID=73025 ORGANISM="Eutreptiella gymnastica-like, Strain CCMP1594" /NCGR_SAMPLE_ID=MMETSP0809 /ASSEMBLY_ACC=CAM_ASM_000658 /LENGTH=192 /DNA_ID=CAMNT_0015379315 /DNA_START=705 /DNA_END=1285 /DNA_ORIENTATION=-